MRRHAVCGPQRAEGDSSGDGEILSGLEACNRFIEKMEEEMVLSSERSYSDSLLS
jgi:hypothetical protein